MKIEKVAMLPAGVFDLRRATATAPAADPFLGARLSVSHHCALEFFRAESTGGSGRLPQQDRFLVILLLEGALDLSAAGTDLSLMPGSVAVLSPGTALDWQTQGQSRWLLHSYRDAGGRAEPALMMVDPVAGLSPSAAPAAVLLDGPTPVCSKADLCAASDGAWSCGLWTATPYRRIPVRYGYYELMLLEKGAVSIFTTDGQRAEFGLGDVFVIAEGAEVGWHSTAPVKKFWSIYTPVSADSA
ncbi:cupin domain-containing protein [Defluviimonas sp. SAOS-178_SWC]|uniref:cupin domain-containing protein n=1 Tax=Defluviimonas sp. SAOS-178_SWC TaxID=3121287 RepID=UPI003221534C